MIFNELETILLGKKEKTRLKFDSIRMSPYRFANKRHLRNRGLIINPF